MKNIKKIQVWSNGQNIELNQINIYIKFDDLKSIAEFGYDLFSDKTHFINGEISLKDQEYKDWSGNNEEAFNIILNKLNLELI
jgi:hypothetical protein